MIEIKKITDANEVQALCKSVGLNCSDSTLAAAMVDREERLGFSVFDLFNGYAVLRWLEPTDNIALADGMLRSSIHIALQNQCASVYYEDTVSESLLEQLGFIMNREQKQLNTHKLFETCGNCK